MKESAPDVRDIQPSSEAELARDRRLEIILDECVMASPVHGWEADLAARVMAARPFAPWEVRRARAWRAPALAAGGLLAASLGVFLTPLWSLGPETALEMWVRAVAAGTTAGLPALLAAIPTIAGALGAVASSAPGVRTALAGGLLASGAIFGTLATLSRRMTRRPLRLAGARVGTPRG
jgi:hypothetical protein